MISRNRRASLLHLVHSAGIQSIGDSLTQWCAKYEIDADVAAVLDHEFGSVAALASTVNNSHVDGK